MTVTPEETFLSLLKICLMASYVFFHLASHASYLQIFLLMTSLVVKILPLPCAQQQIECCIALRIWHHVADLWLAEISNHYLKSTVSLAGRSGWTFSSLIKVIFIHKQKQCKNIPLRV